VPTGPSGRQVFEETYAWRLNAANSRRRRSNMANSPPKFPKLVSLLVLGSEIPSGMCAKLRTVATSNNRHHPLNLSYYCLLATRTDIFVLRAHPVRGEPHTQRNVTGEVAILGKTKSYSHFAPLDSCATTR